MANKEQIIEEQEVDETAEKAAEIGKELGVEEKEGDIPDYDIQETSEEDDDKKVAKEREPKIEKKDRPKLSNKEKRDQRKKRINERFAAKDAELAALRSENESFKRWQQEVDGRLKSFNKNEVDNAIAKNTLDFQSAEKDHAEAFREGDGTKATDAMKRMYDARRNLEQLQGLKVQLDKQPAQPQNNGFDNSIVRKANEWASKNPWYKPDGADVDSEIAKAVSGVLVKEGFDPKSDEFWDELDERLSERLPEKYGKDEDEDEEEIEEEQPKQKKRSSPPINGGSARGDTKGKVKISLPTAFIDTMKQNGIWEDVEKRNRVIKRYMDQQKAERGNA